MSTIQATLEQLDCAIALAHHFQPTGHPQTPDHHTQMDFFNDLNALRHVEMKLSGAQRIDYWRCLELAYIDDESEMRYNEWLILLDAPTRAKALYKVVSNGPETVPDVVEERRAKLHLKPALPLDAVELEEIVDQNRAFLPVIESVVESNRGTSHESTIITLLELGQREARLLATIADRDRVLGNILGLARLKWGNLDPDAHILMCEAEHLLGREPMLNNSGEITPPSAWAKENISGEY